MKEESVTEVIWTPNKHTGKSDQLKNSPLWKGCYSNEEMSEELIRSKSRWYIYHIKFNGLTPIMITKTSEA